MRRKPYPKFFAMVKDFNTGELEPYDVLEVVFRHIFTDKGRINKKQFCMFDENYKRIEITERKQCDTFVNNKLTYYFSGKCEYEFIAIDWPYRDTIEKSRPVKIDVYEQLKPNITIIYDLVWDYVKDKIKK